MKPARARFVRAQPSMVDAQTIIAETVAGEPLRLGVQAQLRPDWNA
jgi:hypothetical protein